MISSKTSLGRAQLEAGLHKTFSAYASIIALNYDWDILKVYDSAAEKLFDEMIKCKSRDMYT